MSGQSPFGGQETRRRNRLCPSCGRVEPSTVYVDLADDVAIVEWACGYREKQDPPETGPWDYLKPSEKVLRWFLVAVLVVAILIFLTWGPYYFGWWRFKLPFWEL